MLIEKTWYLAVFCCNYHNAGIFIYLHSLFWEIGSKGFEYSKTRAFCNKKAFQDAYRLLVDRDWEGRGGCCSGGSAVQGVGAVRGWVCLRAVITDIYFIVSPICRCGRKPAVLSALVLVFLSRLGSIFAPIFYLFVALRVVCLGSCMGFYTQGYLLGEYAKIVQGIVFLT